jgi:SAM-dependent methyltransferase
MTTTLVRALQALVDGDAEAAHLAVQGDTSLLGSALSQYLRPEGQGSEGGGLVYDQPAAFEAFIRGGGNVPLYSAVSAALADLYDEYRAVTLLDVGCGDGMALLPALQAAQHRPARVDVVEPSEALLQAATSALRGWQDSHGDPGGQPPVVHTWPKTVQDFLTDPRAAGHTRWDLVESTFALHTLPHLERDAVLRALRPRTGRLAVVEFDVPEAAVGSPAHLEFLARTYEQGLGEYGEQRELVAQGFLMPVLTGQLRPGAVRATFEQPADAWAEQVRGAGYTDVVVTVLYDYWSSPAFLLTARGTAE